MHWSHGMQEVGFDIVNVGIIILLCNWVVAGTTLHTKRVVCLVSLLTSLT